ncbi:MAG TPA: CPBP family intramembrane glutamic endopeptidase [Gemmatimonadales bacterium]|jgi:hypothetical protein
MDPPAPAANSVVRPAILFEAGLILVAALLDRWLETRAVVLLRFDLRFVALGMLSAIPPLAVFWGLVRSRLRLFADLRAAAVGRVIPLFRGASLGELALLALAAGVGEELLFRGVLQTALIGWMGGTVPGLVASAALFGAAHVVTRTYAVLAAMVGVYLGVLVLLTGSVIPAMVAHAGYDFIALVLLLREIEARSRAGE